MFELAMERGPEEFMTQIVQLSDVLSQNPDLDKLMKHPGIAKQEKSRVLEEIFGKYVSAELMGFLKLIVAKERYKDLPDILQYFIVRMKEYQKIGTAHVTTAKALSDEQKAQVEKRLLDTTVYEAVEVDYQVDESLIGGMVIRINDRVVDSSIKTKLNDLTKQLMQIQLS